MDVSGCTGPARRHIYIYIAYIAFSNPDDRHGVWAIAATIYSDIVEAPRSGFGLVLVAPSCCTCATTIWMLGLGLKAVPVREPPVGAPSDSRGWGGPCYRQPKGPAGGLMSRWSRIWLWVSAVWIWIVVDVQLDLVSRSIDPFSRAIRAVRLRTPQWEIDWAHWFEGVVLFGPPLVVLLVGRLGFWFARRVMRLRRVEVNGVPIRERQAMHATPKVEPTREE